MAEISLITGAASGLGYEFAKLCSANNYDLILVDKDEEKLLRVQQELVDEFKNSVYIIPLDLGEADAAEKVYEKIEGYTINVLINNAGFGIVGRFIETDWQREQQMIYLHIFTLTLLTKLISKKMVEQGTGKILNVASLAAFYPGPMMAVYYATKAYILSFSEALAKELEETGVTITVICPGFVKTGFREAAGSKQHLVSKWNILADPGQIARYGFKAMKKGRVVAVPGIISKLIIAVLWMLPRKIVANIVASLQKVNQKDDNSEIPTKSN